MPDFIRLGFLCFEVDVHLQLSLLLESLVGLDRGPVQLASLQGWLEVHVLG